jgi:drug/metabolite transporter (DMT)-like permease
MATEVLALVNAVAQAGSNVSGGAASRRSNPISVLLIASPIGLAVALLALAMSGGVSPSLPPVGWGVAAGVMGGIGMIASYRALTLGEVGVVVPVTTCIATLTQVGSSWALDGRPASTTMIGALVCIAAVVLISRGTMETNRASAHGATILLASVAGVLFAGFTVLISRVDGPSGLWAVVGARIGILLVVLVMATVMRVGPPTERTVLGLAVVAGTLDVSANLLLMAALAGSSLSVVVVLASTGPVFAALLAWVFLGEKLKGMQWAGLGMGLAGVWLVVAG